MTLKTIALTAAVALSVLLSLNANIASAKSTEQIESQQVISWVGSSATQRRCEESGLTYDSSAGTCM